jgi:Txe/YoeB family toxin of Txe-Axe toxin-antitoxin module
MMLQVNCEIHRLSTNKFSIFKCINFYIWKNFKELVYKIQREPFQSLELLQQRTENVWPLISQDNFRWVQAIIQEKASPILH